jgi:hypothetical protein
MMRANLASVSQLWRSTAMAAYRAGWILLAGLHKEEDIFHVLRTKTGLQWFTRCNRNRSTFGLAPTLTAPAFAAVGNPGTLSAAHDGPPATYFNISETSDPIGTEAVVILATKGLSQGLLTFSNQAKIVKTIYPGAPGPWDILTEYTAKFKAPITDKQIFIVVRYIDTAQGRAGLDAVTSLVW